MGRLVAAVVFGGLVAVIDRGFTALVLLSSVPLAFVEEGVERMPSRVVIATCGVWVAAFFVFPAAWLQAAYTRAIFAGASPGVALEKVQLLLGRVTGTEELGVFALLATSVASAFAIRYFLDRPPPALDEPEQPATARNIAGALAAPLAVVPLFTLMLADGFGYFLVEQKFPEE